jgi:Flp pilus assembly protein CpaB
MPLSTSPRNRLRAARRAVLRRRRPLAALAAGIAVAAAVQTVAAPPPARVQVLTAAHDLPAGSVVGEGDLTRVGFAPGTAPAGLADHPVGRTVATAVRRGEPLTDVRLVAPALSDAGLSSEGRIATPVRLPDAAMAALLAVGDRIDLLATDPQTGTSETVASGVPVLALPRSAPDADTPGALVVVGVLPDEVTDVTSPAVGSFPRFAFSR